MFLFRFRRYDLLVSFACVALLSSFAWYALKGPRGYDFRSNLESQIAELAAENAKLGSEKAMLEKRVQLLRPEHIDLDMLEELARSDLNMARPDEVIVQVQN